MIDSIRGLPGVYNILSPAAYQAQENAGAENRSPHLQHAQNDTPGVRVTLSQEAVALVRGDTEKNESRQNQTTGAETQTENNPAGGMDNGEENSGNGIKELTNEEERQVDKLEKRDREVRAHEQAHLAAAAGLATSGINYQFETGPDGKRYAIGGEVNITIQEGKTPDETIRNAQKARSAALAPADPSAQDRRVASEASAMIAEASSEKLEEDNEETQGTGDSTQGNSPEIQAASASAQGNSPEIQAASASAQGNSPEIQAASASAQGNSPETQAASASAQGNNPETQAASTSTQGNNDTTQNAIAGGVQKTVEILGRQAFAIQSQLERGYTQGLTFSSMILQA